MRTSLLALSALLVAACSDPPPPPVQVTLGETPDTLILVDAVTASHAAPLSGDRWAVLALNERKVHLADFAAKRVTLFPGMTPAEVDKPSVLFGMGDTVVVGDWGLRRFTKWTPGQPRLEAIPAHDALGGALPRAADGAGNWYFQLAPRGGGRGTAQRDSTAIVRADAMLSRFDTVGRLAPREMTPVDDGYGASLIALALSGEDRWLVLPDGKLIIARTFQNRLEWYPANGGTPVRGVLLPDPLLVVQPMDKEIYIRRYPEDQRENARTSTQWAAIKPPFEKIFTGPDGLTWLFKSAAALDSVRQFQVADSLRVHRVISVPSYGMALAVSREAILMAEEFPGGIRLLRYRLPAEALRP